MTAADSLRSPLRAAAYRTLIGLLAVTGMRVGEAIGLDHGDADLEVGILTIRSGKNGKSRLIPLHDTATAAVCGYLRDRDRLRPEPARSQALLISPPCSRLLYCNIHATWKKLTAAAGLRPRSGNCRPRIHDLRHGFSRFRQVTQTPVNVVLELRP